MDVTRPLYAFCSEREDSERVGEDFICADGRWSGELDLRRPPLLCALTSSVLVCSTTWSSDFRGVPMFCSAGLEDRVEGPVSSLRQCCWPSSCFHALGLGFAVTEDTPGPLGSFVETLASSAEPKCRGLGVFPLVGWSLDCTTGRSVQTFKDVLPVAPEVFCAGWAAGCGTDFLDMNWTSNPFFGIKVPLTFFPSLDMLV